MKLSNLKETRVHHISPEKIRSATQKLSSMLEYDAIVLRKQMFSALLSTFVDKLVDEEKKDYTEAVKELDKVLDKAIDDDVVLVKDAEAMKASILSDKFKILDLGNVFLSKAMYNYTKIVPSKTTNPKLILAMEDITKSTKVIDESGDLIVEEIVCAAAKQCLDTCSRYFPADFTNRLR